MLASQQVLQRMAELLLAAGTGSGARVDTGRFHPVDTYPHTLVAPMGEDLSADDDGDDVIWPRITLHRLTVDVRVACEATAGLDMAMAEAALEVLLALEGTTAAVTLAPLPGCALKATDLRYQAPGENQAAHGTATVRFEVLFRTRSNDPETLI